MALLPFRRTGGEGMTATGIDAGARGAARSGGAPTPVAAFLKGYSIEVMPRTAARVDDFRAILPEASRVCIAHIDGTPIGEMVATARRLAADGFQVMPHFPARIIADRAELGEWIARYRGEAGVRQGLILAGSPSRPRGPFASAMDLLETGLFDGFERLHVAGHPEGNRDIDPDGGDENVMAALRWKTAFAERTDATMALVTQFCFDAAPVIDWVNRLAGEGIALPVHVGIAGPARLQTLIRFAIACGVGPSLKVLQKRAMDVTRLVKPYEPTAIISALAACKAANPAFNIEQVHFFPLGGIAATARWAIEHGGRYTRPANAA